MKPNPINDPRGGIFSTGTSLSNAPSWLDSLLRQIRELREELGIDVSEPCLAPFTFASHAYDDFVLLMPLYVCRRWDGVPRARVHQALKWVHPRALTQFKMPPADAPLIPMLRDLL